MRLIYTRSKIIVKCCYTTNHVISYNIWNKIEERLRVRESDQLYVAIRTGLDHTGFFINSGIWFFNGGGKKYMRLLDTHTKVIKSCCAITLRVITIHEWNIVYNKLNFSLDDPIWHSIEAIIRAIKASRTGAVL